MFELPGKGNGNGNGNSSSKLTLGIQSVNSCCHLSTVTYRPLIVNATEGGSGGTTEPPNLGENSGNRVSEKTHGLARNSGKIALCLTGLTPILLID